MAALRVLGETSRKVSSFIRLNGLAAVPQGNFFPFPGRKCIEYLR